jgi:hypothetical protein
MVPVAFACQQEVQKDAAVRYSNHHRQGHRKMGQPPPTMAYPPLEGRHGGGRVTEMPELELLDLLRQVDGLPEHIASLALKHGHMRLLAWLLKTLVDANGKGDSLPLSGDEGMRRLLNAGAIVTSQTLTEVSSRGNEGVMQASNKRKCSLPDFPVGERDDFSIMKSIVPDIHGNTPYRFFVVDEKKCVVPTGAKRLRNHNGFSTWTIANQAANRAKKHV